MTKKLAILLIVLVSSACTLPVVPVVVVAATIPALAIPTPRSYASYPDPNAFDPGPGWNQTATYDPSPSYDSADWEYGDDMILRVFEHDIAFYVRMVGNQSLDSKDYGAPMAEMTRIMLDWGVPPNVVAALFNKFDEAAWTGLGRLDGWYYNIAYSGSEIFFYVQGPEDE